MIWSTETIERLLKLYLQNQLLWDPKHPLHNDKDHRDQAMQNVVNTLGVANITAEDISRKFRSMRAAYRVEIRNINTAKLRGFFYKPSLHWFPIFRQFMKTVEDIKAKESKQLPSNLRIQGVSEEGTRYVIIGEPMSGVNQLDTDPTDMDMPKELENDLNSQMYSEEENSSEDSEDEFQSFADHIAEQLRSMSVHRAVMIQNKIQRIFANDREINEIHDDYIDDEQEEMI